MAWRLHLTNQAIPDLNIIDGDPPLLAAWSRRERVTFYDLATGTLRGEQIMLPVGANNRQGTEWQTFVTSLKAPNGSYLPSIRFPQLAVHLTDDGRLRLYQISEKELYLDSDGAEIPLDTSHTSGFVAVVLDRFLGLISAIDRSNQLNIYQQQIRVGTFEVGLELQDDLHPSIAISHGGGSIFATDGNRIVLTDSGGTVQKTLVTPYVIRLIACAPDGRYLATCDMDTGVIRVYSGADLALSYQRFAIDLVAEATQIQLMADMPPYTVGPNVLRIDNAGNIAFSMAGIICVTHISYMDKVPRPQALI